MKPYEQIRIAMVSFEKVRGRRPSSAHVGAMVGISKYSAYQYMKIIRANNALIGVKPTREMMEAARKVRVLSEAEINAKKVRGGKKAARRGKRLSEQEAIERVVEKAQRQPAGVDVMHDYRKVGLFRGRVRARRIG